ncbi:MAG: acyl-CoA thioesterase [Marinicellaceae bacterium]
MKNQLEKFESLYKVTVEIPVQWGDMDAFNHVNNAQYFSYFESARIAYFEKLGVMGAASDSNDVAPILAETSCRFKLPLYYPDNILVGARIIERHSHGFQMEYAIFSNQHQKITSIGTGRIVMLDYKSHQKIAVNNQILEKINSIENKLI